MSSYKHIEIATNTSTYKKLPNRNYTEITHLSTVVVNKAERMEYIYSGTFDNEALVHLKKLLEEDIVAERHRLFISNLELYNVTSNVITLKTPLHSNIKVLERYYKGMLENRISDITKYEYKIRFIVIEQEDIKNNVNKEKALNLNPDYNFEEFVEAQCNNIAVEAAKSIAEYVKNISSESENKDDNLSPCFIYGGVGLGKTHLIQAIGNYVKNNNPDANVLYVTSEQFLNEYVQSISNKTMTVFQHKYRNCDLLLIDDIQFIKEKIGVQEELFNTFNELYNKHKRIVFTSDKRPSELGGIEDRLKTRFAWGLTTDIQPPDFETRMAIINKKLEKVKMEVPVNVREKIANSLTKNIRELEGCLNTLIQTCVLTNQHPNMEIAKNVINKIVNESSKKIISCYDIKAAVADYYRIPVEELDKKNRTKDIAHARQVAMYITRQITDASLPKIGQDFGGKDHSTVHNAIKKITRSIKMDFKLENDIKTITNELNSI